MSELAERERRVKRGWAIPGGAHDRIIKLALARESALLTGLSKKDVDALIGYLHILLKNLPVVEATRSMT